MRSQPAERFFPKETSLLWQKRDSEVFRKYQKKLSEGLCQTFLPIVRDETHVLMKRLSDATFLLELDISCDVLNLFVSVPTEHFRNSEAVV